MSNDIYKKYCFFFFKKKKKKKKTAQNDEKELTINSKQQSLMSKLV